MNILAVDVGGTSTKYGLLDENDQITMRGAVPTRASGPAELETLFVSIYERVKGCAQAVAVSMPGVIDTNRGYLYSGGNLRWIHNLSFAQRLQELVGGLPVSIENDAKAAALAELTTGALQGCQTAAVVLCGTGLGGGVIVNGEVLRGARQMAGEISYLCMENGFGRNRRSFMGERCGIVALYEKAAEYMRVPLEKMDGVRLFAEAQAGNRGALRALRAFCGELAQMLLNLQCLLDPEKIAIGGGISAQGLLLEILQEELEYAKTDTLQEIAHLLQPVLVPCRYGNDANLLGAAYRLRRRLAEAKT